MGSALESYVNRVVSIITADGRNFVPFVDFVKTCTANSTQVLLLVIFCIPRYEKSKVTLTTMGTLKGFDQTINIILDESQERVYNPNQGVEQITLGLHIIRGDNIAVIGELDEEVDARLDFSAIKAEALNPIIH